jgi:hypothetical protein
MAKGKHIVLLLYLFGWFLGCDYFSHYYGDFTRYVFFSVFIINNVVIALAVIWTVFSFFACCCRRNILHPLSGFALLSAIGLVVALAFFYSNYKNEIDGTNWGQFASNISNIQQNSNLGYSFFLGCAALAACIIAIIVGGLLSCCVKNKD